MIIDKLLEFSDAQAVTATAASTFVRNPKSDIGNGKPLFLNVILDESFTAEGAATMAVEFQDSADNSSFTTRIAVAAATGKASLTKGKKWVLPLPPGLGAYLRMNYTVATGPMTAGKVSAFITYGNDHNPAYQAA